MQHAHDFANLRNLQETYDNAQTEDVQVDADPLAQEANALRKYIKSYIGVESDHIVEAPASIESEIDFDQISSDLSTALSSYTSDLDLFYANHLGIDLGYKYRTFAQTNHYCRLAGVQFKD